MTCCDIILYMARHGAILVALLDVMRVRRHFSRPGVVVYYLTIAEDTPAARAPSAGIWMAM